MVKQIYEINETEIFESFGFLGLAEIRKKKIIRGFLSKEKISEETAKNMREKFNNFLVVGTELECQNKKASNRDKLREVLKPTKMYGSIPDNLVVDFHQDGSLHTDGSIEVIMIGDTGRYEEIRDKYDYVEQKLKECEYFTDGECGQHISILSIKPFRIPATIFKNIFQISKLYSPEMAYLMSCGTRANIEEPMIRSGALRYAGWNFKDITSINKKSIDLIKSCSSDNKNGGKYGFFNIYKTRVIPPEFDDVGELFIEYRIPDRCSLPSVSVAWNFMIKAIALKACTISKAGLFTFSNDVWKDKKVMLDKIFNSPVKIMEKDEPFKRKVRMFLDFLEPEFEYMKAENALKVLRFITEYPLWSGFYLINKEDYDYLNKKNDFRLDLENYLKNYVCKNKKDDEVLSKTIIKMELLAGIEAESENDLINKLIETTTYTEITISKVIDELKVKKDLEFRNGLYFIKE